MYLIYINVSSFAKTEKLYFYFIVRFKLYVIVNSMILLTLINLNNKLYVDYVNTYMYVFFKNATLLLFIILCFFYQKSSFYIEVNTFNVKAFSLYLWLGFQLLYQRTGYYHAFSNQVFVTMYSYNAYTLSLHKFYCKNMLRRILIFLNK